MNTLRDAMSNPARKLISEMMCVPLACGQALVEIHLKQPILTDDPVPYSRKRRVKHTFIVRDQGQDIKFEVFARATVLPKGRTVSSVRRETPDFRTN
jgi:hypothetical protein